MQSALDQWVAIEHIREVAKRVLPEEECHLIDLATRVGAKSTLERLDEHKKRATPVGAPPRGSEEPVEEPEAGLRQVLARVGEA